MIKITNLTKRFGNLLAVDRLSLQIDEGDIFGFVGPNGAGKTTTIRMLATLLRPTSGDALVCGHSIRFSPHVIRSLIGYMPDFFGVYENMRVDEYLEFFAAAYRIDEQQRKRIIADVLELTDLLGKTDALVLSLSRGMQQRLGLARILIHDPKVLLLDEPASGLDPRARVEIRQLLKELRDMGKTILISSHILSELGEMCNKIGIIENGRLEYSGSLDELVKKVTDRVVLRIKVDADPHHAADFLTTCRDITAASVLDGEIRVELARRHNNPDSYVSDLLFRNGFPVSVYVPETADLEDVFMRLTKGTVS